MLWCFEAGLLRNVPKQWRLNYDVNDTTWDNIWEEDSSYDSGVIALDDAYAKSMGLPRSRKQRHIDGNIESLASQDVRILSYSRNGYEKLTVRD